MSRNTRGNKNKDSRSQESIDMALVDPPRPKHIPEKLPVSGNEGNQQTQINRVCLRPESASKWKARGGSRQL